jgi:acetyl-CoA synthetase
VIVLRRTGSEVAMSAPRDCWWHEEVAQASAHCPAEPMDSEAPLFILYTSGSTGKPKGILHTTGGYLLYSKLTSKYVFRFAARGCLLVHGGRWLGDGP